MDAQGAALPNCPQWIGFRNPFKICPAMHSGMLGNFAMSKGKFDPGIVTTKILVYLIAATRNFANTRQILSEVNTFLLFLWPGDCLPNWTTRAY